MARILITSGPTRQYLDPVRYLTNASSGRMGKALVEAALACGHEVVLVTGPVEIEYPTNVKLQQVVSTEEMLEVCLAEFPGCDGAIGAAAPCDYRPRMVQPGKIAKTGAPLQLELVETADVVASLGQIKRPEQWLVGFALETEDHRLRALAKLERKSCDLMVSNSASAIDSPDNTVEIIDHQGTVLATYSGPKPLVARGILREIELRLVFPRATPL